MAELSQLSDDQLRELYKQSAPSPAPSKDLSQMSDDELRQAYHAGGPEQPQTSLGEAIMRGGAEGGGFGFEPKIAGLQAAGRQDPNKFMPGETDIGTLARGAYRYWGGDPEAARRYEATQAAERARNVLTHAEHPTAYNLSQVGGALAVPIPGLEGAAEGRTAMQMLRGRMAGNALIGGGMGALQGVGEARGDVGDYLKQAGLGGAIGAAGGAVATPLTELGIQAARYGARPLTYPLRALFDTENTAARKIAEAVGKDVRTTPASERLTDLSHPESMVADLGAGATQGLARAAANISPEAENILSKAIDDRFTGQSARGADFVNRQFHYPNPEATQQALDQVEQTTNRTNYQRAFTQGDRPIMTSRMRDMINNSPAVREAIQTAIPETQNRAVIQGVGARDPGITFDNRGMPAFNNGPPNLFFWDTVKKELDAQARQGRGSSGGLARMLRDELDVATRDASGASSYQTARQGAARFFGAENALDAGRNFFTSNMTARQGREALARFSPTERQLFQDGLMGQVLKHFSGNGGLIQNTDRTNVMNRIGKSDAAREKLEVGLGPQGWRQMEAMLRTENIFDRMRGAVKGNSSTIKQYMAIAAAGGFGGYEEGGPEGGLSGASMAALMLGGTKAMKAKIDEKVMLQVAKMLVSRDANVVQRGRDVLARSNSLMNALRHIDTATAKGVGSEAGSYTPPRVYITKD